MTPGRSAITALAAATTTDWIACLMLAGIGWLALSL